MIIIAGSLQVDPSDLDAFRAAVTPMMEASNAEAGCGAYVFSEEIGAPGLIRLFEKWDDGESLDAHFKSAHMATWREASAGLVRSRDLQIWRDAAEGATL